MSQSFSRELDQTVIKKSRTKGSDTLFENDSRLPSKKKPTPKSILNNVQSSSHTKYSDISKNIQDNTDHQLLSLSPLFKTENKEILASNNTSTQKEYDTIDIKNPLFRQKFNEKFEIIEEKLQNRGYFLTKYLNEGGEGIIFEGIKKLENGQCITLVFKVILDSTKKEFIEQIEIMNRFEKQTNIIDLKESIECVENEVYVLVLEKCKYSFQDWLTLVKQKQIIVTPEDLIILILDLVDGLIQLRIYKILHLDIKPGNILFSQTGSIIYSDFGISMKYDSELEIKGFSKKYAPHEQQDIEMNGKDIDYKADVYSLGVTLQDIFHVCKQVTNQNKTAIDLINLLESITAQHMSVQMQSKRKDCLVIHELMFEIFTNFKFENLPNLLLKYEQKLIKIISLEIFDKNKDISYFLELKCYYLRILLHVQQLIHHNVDHQDITRTLQKLGDIYCQLGDIFTGVGYEEQCLQMKRSLLQQKDLSLKIKREIEIDTIWLINNIGVSYLKLDNYRLALSYFFDSLKQRKEKDSTNTLGIALTLNNIGCTLSRLGDYSKALKFKLQSLNLRKKILKPNDLLIATALNSVGIGFSKLGDIPYSFKYLFKALKIRKEVLLMRDHPDISQSFHCIGISFGMIGDYQTNLYYQLKALNIRRQIYKGKSHLDIAQSLNSVAKCYCELGDFQNAIKYALESLVMSKAITSNSFQSISYELAENLETVASIYNEMGDSETALQYGKDSLEMKRTLFEGDSIETTKTLDSVGNIYKKLGKVKKAIRYYQYSLQIKVNTFKSRNHPFIASSLQNIGTCYRALNNFEIALDYLNNSLIMRNQLFPFDTYPDLGISYYEISCTLQLKYSYDKGNAHQQQEKMQKSLYDIHKSNIILTQYFKRENPLIAHTLNQLGIISLILENLDEAKEYFFKSLEMRQLLFKGAHPHIIENLDNLSCCYYKLRDLKNAIKYQLKCLEMKRILYGKHHQSIDYSLNCLAIYHSEIDDYLNELIYYQDSLEIKRINSKDDHLKISDCLDNIGWSQIKLHNLDHALQTFYDSLKLRQRLLRNNSGYIVQSWNNIGYCLYEQGNLQRAQLYIKLISKMKCSIVTEEQSLVSIQTTQMLTEEAFSNKYQVEKNTDLQLHQIEQTIRQQNSYQSNNFITFTNLEIPRIANYQQIRVHRADYREEDSKLFFKFNIPPAINNNNVFQQDCKSVKKSAPVTALIPHNNTQSCQIITNKENIQLWLTLTVEEETPLKTIRQQHLNLPSQWHFENNKLLNISMQIQREEQIINLNFQEDDHLEQLQNQQQLLPLNRSTIVLKFSLTGDEISDDQRQLLGIVFQVIDYSIPQQLRILPSVLRSTYFKRRDSSLKTELFEQYQLLIEEELKKKNYFIVRYLSQGGEGIIFEGQCQISSQERENVVFKVIFPKKKEDFDNEINVFRLFEKKKKRINVVEYKDSLEILENTVYVIVLEKCVSSLQSELETIQSFSSSKLFQMIFDLLDGLIQFRVYNILHLDIKPSNILISKEGVYLYTDFGISSIKKLDSKTEIKGYTKYYASLEQLNKDPNTDFSSDVYSLGRTFQGILDEYTRKKKNNKKDQFISVLGDIVNNYMVTPQKQMRKNCLELHGLIFKSISFSKKNQFLIYYIQKISDILNLYVFDENKDVPYFLQLRIYYLHILLKLQIIVYNNHSEEIAYTHQTLGLNYCELGDPQTGLWHELEALQILQSLFKMTHHRIAGLLNSIGCSYIRLEDYPNSLKYIEESLQMRRQLFPGNHFDIAKTVNNLAISQIILGYFDLALQNMKESLKIRVQLFKTDHQSIATLLFSLATYYCDIGDTTKAERYTSKYFRMITRLYKEQFQHPEGARAYYCLGCNQFARGNYEAALKYQLKSLEIYWKIYEKDHPDIADQLNQISSYYFYLGYYVIALLYAYDAITMLANIFKERFDCNLKTALSYSLMSKCYCRIGQSEKAIEYAKLSLDIRKNKLSEQHTQVADSLSDLGSIYYSSNRIIEAIDKQQQALSISKQFWKRDHPKTAQILFDLGCSYQKQNDFKSALLFFKESLKMRTQILIKTHPDITSTLFQIACCYQELQQNPLALLYQIHVCCRQRQFKSHSFLPLNL